MSAAVRYYITSQPIGFTNNSGAAVRVVQSGKLVSASPSAASPIVTVPAGPKDSDLLMYIEGVFNDAVAKTGQGYAFLQISEPGADPVMVQTEKAVEDGARFLLKPAMSIANLGNTPGIGALNLVVRPGQRFAIIDAGFAL